MRPRRAGPAPSLPSLGPRGRRPLASCLSEGYIKTGYIHDCMPCTSCCLQGRFALELACTRHTAHRFTPLCSDSTPTQLTGARTHANAHSLSRDPQLLTILPRVPADQLTLSGGTGSRSCHVKAPDWTWAHPSLAVRSNVRSKSSNVRLLCVKCAVSCLTRIKRRRRAGSSPSPALIRWC